MLYLFGERDQGDEGSDEQQSRNPVEGFVDSLAKSASGDDRANEAASGCSGGEIDGGRQQEGNGEYPCTESQRWQFTDPVVEEMLEVSGDDMPAVRANSEGRTSPRDSRG